MDLINLFTQSLIYLTKKNMEHSDDERLNRAPGRRATRSQSRAGTPPRATSRRLSLFSPSQVLDYASDMSKAINVGREQLRETQLRWTMVKTDINQLRERVRLPQNPADFQRTHPSPSLENLIRLTNEKDTFFTGLSNEADNFDTQINHVTEQFDRMCTESAEVRRQLLATEYSQLQRGAAGSPNRQRNYMF